MEKIIKKSIGTASLRKSFQAAMTVVVLAVMLASVATILLCLFLRNWLLPESDSVNLIINTKVTDGIETVETSVMHMIKLSEETKPPQLVSTDAPWYDSIDKKNQTVEVSYQVDKIVRDYEMLTPKRKLVYMGLGAAMIVMPVFYAVIGVISGAVWFYRKKLEPPILALEEAAQNITDNNLDFEITYASDNEMGKLCRSFEKMRSALYDNNREVWNLMRERNLMYASVAHDLRNPTAVIKGYTERLQNELEKGNADSSRLGHMVSGIDKGVERIERYTDSIRDIQNLENIEIKKEKCELKRLLSEMTADLRLFVEDTGKSFDVELSVADGDCYVDRAEVYRMLENLIVNAVRFGNAHIGLRAETDNNMLRFTVTDDGSGFSEKVLETKGKIMYTTEKNKGHIGMGLVMCRILAHKHGGSLELENQTEGGACTTLEINIAKS